jgi:uncharacterized membrane protein
MVRLAALIAGALAFSLGVSLPAKADLRICNNTASRVGVAIGYKDNQGWASEGWWTMEPATDPKKCTSLLKGNLIARYYYVYAVDYSKGGSWGGTSMFCIRERVFTIRGINDCVGRGYQKAGFIEIDTKEEADWTLSLTDADKKSPTVGQ